MIFAIFRFFARFSRFMVSRLILAFGLTGMLLGLTAPDSVSGAPATGLDNPVLSMHLTPPLDYQPGLQFLDLMKIARAWVGHQPGRWGGMDYDALEAGGYLDAQGWPVRIPKGVEKIGTIWTWGASDPDKAYRKGLYVLKYEGEGDLKLSGNVRVQSQTNGIITFEAKGASFRLDIHDTDPKGTGNHLRNITIVKKDHVDLYDAGAVFNPDWLALIHDIRDVRFMHWEGTTNSELKSWNQRVTPEYGPHSDVALEHLVQLANEIGANPWFTMPHQADEDYLRKAATYVRDHLDPNLKAKVEYSNEAWNWAFQQTHWLRDQSKSVWGVEAHTDYYVKKSVETALIWEDVFGNEADARLVNVLGAHLNNISVGKRVLAPVVWREKEPQAYVDPATVFEEIAVTTYFGSAAIGRVEMRDALLAAIQDPNVDAYQFIYDQLHAPDFVTSLPSVMAQLEGYRDLADTSGLVLSTYEGGQHVHHSFAVKNLTKQQVETLTTFMVDFVRSPQMLELYRQSWADWAAVGGGAYMQFGDMVVPGRWGSFGLFEGLTLVTDRGMLLTQLNRDTQPWWPAKGGAHYLQGVTTIGSANADMLEGTPQEDYLIGKDGDDTFVADAGNDGINGGVGLDRLMLQGDLRDYATVSYTHLTLPTKA